MRILIHISCILPLYLIHFSVFAQKQANVWHFGDGHAVDFNSGEPVKLSGSQIFTPEGSASYCDPEGRLLFYTNGGGREPDFSGQDGGGIWNRQNGVMYDMQGIEGGGFSAVQSALIIEAPGQDSVYYVFTMDETEWDIGASPAIVAAQPGGRGFSYFTVDMRLNAGLGGVVLADQRVFTPSYEGLCAIRHANKRDYWLLIHQGSGGLGVYSVTPSGVSLANTYSALGASQGNIKASPNGALVVAQFEPNPQLLQFNTVTGQLSDPLALPGLSPRYEFSPNSRFLYELHSVAGDELVLRYDLQASNIIATASTIGSLSSLGGPIIPGQPQLGPDGRIYFLAINFFTGIKYLNRITCPNTLTATLQLDVLNFSSDDVYFCLPNFSSWLFEDDENVFVSLGPDTIDLCATGGLLVLDALNPGANYTWSTGANSQRISVSTPGVYSVTVTTECGSGTDEVVVVSCEQESVVCNVFQYTGNRQQWVVPVGVDTIQVKIWGAAGGGGPDPTNNAGGGGGFTEVSLLVNAGEVIDIVVGGGGAPAQGNNGGAGGWPNGGNGGSGNRVELGLNVGGGGGGGGRSEIIRGGNSLAIAGGGGGGAYNRNGGGGGGLNANFTVANNTFAVNGFGGTQTAGGAPAANSICGNPVQGTAGASFQGGTGATDLGVGNTRTGGGGGGDGFFGGGGGSSHDDCFNAGSTGGGGSGFICNTCTGLSGTTVTAGFLGIPGNAADPLLTNFPGITAGSDNQAGGNGLIQICYNVCNPTIDNISLSSCGPYTASSGAVFSTSGIYMDTLVNAAGCDSILQITLTVISVPSVTITGGTVVCNGQPLSLMATVAGGGGELSYFWSGGESKTEISVASAGDYSVTVSNLCGNGRSEVSVTTANSPLVSILASDTLCQGTTQLLLANAVGASSVRWSTGATTTELLVNSGGQYAVTVSNACGSNSDSVRLVELPLPEVNIVGDSVLCTGDNIRLTAIAENADSYFWFAGTGDNQQLSDSVINISSGGLVRVTVTNACGQAIDEQAVTEFSNCGEACRYDFPNVFSPNDDGINDDFQPFSNCIAERFELLIYNRWGELLYRSEDAAGRWDGTYRGENCPAEIYTYLLRYTFLRQAPKIVSGDLLLLR